MSPTLVYGVNSDLQWCGSGMFIPDPTFFHPGSRIWIFCIPDSIKVFTKKLFLSSRKYDPGCSSRIWIRDPDPNFYPSRIRIRYTADLDWEVDIERVPGVAQMLPEALVQIFRQPNVLNTRKIIKRHPWSKPFLTDSPPPWFPARFRLY